MPLVTAVGAGNVPFLGAVADMFNAVAGLADGASQRLVVDAETLHDRDARKLSGLGVRPRLAELPKQVVVDLSLIHIFPSEQPCPVPS